MDLFNKLYTFEGERI